MIVCGPCKRGKHNHDRWTATGADAGCPNQGVPGHPEIPCDCPHVIPTLRGRCPTCGRSDG